MPGGGGGGGGWSENQNPENLGLYFYSCYKKQEAYRPDSSAIYNRLSGHRKFTKSSNISLKITHLASRKSCLVIIYPNSHRKLTKSKKK